MYKTQEHEKNLAKEFWQHKNLKQKTKKKLDNVEKTYLEITKCSTKGESTLSPPKIVITSIIYIFG